MLVLSLLKEDRVVVQTPSCCNESLSHWLSTDRYRAYMKHAFVLNKEHYKHRFDGVFLCKRFRRNEQYDVNEKNAYAYVYSPMTQSLCWFESPAMIAHRTLASSNSVLPSDWVSTRSHVCEWNNTRRICSSTPIICMIASSLWRDCASTIAMFTVRSSSSLPAKWVMIDFDLRLSAGKGYREVRTRTITSWLRAADSSLIKLDQGCMELWCRSRHSTFQ